VYCLLVSSIDFVIKEVVKHRWCRRGIHSGYCFLMVVRARLRPIIHRLMGGGLVTTDRYRSIGFLAEPLINLVEIFLIYLPV
jgi:hypothetical protein